MNLTQIAWENGQWAKVRELLQLSQPLEGQQDMRGWEWHYQWELRHADLCRIIQGHTGVIHSLVVSPDGASVASGSTDGTVKVWDACTGVERLSLPGHTSWLNCMAYSPDGQRLAAGSTSNT